MRNSGSFIAAAVIILIMASTAASPAKADSQAGKNTTGLPTYPQDKDGRMDAIARSLPNGQNCTHYASGTTDPLATVIEWYKKALPGAKIEDVNKDSLYGGYFKLDGVKFLAGNDIVNVYRGPGSAGVKRTSIEIFKCRNAPKPAAQ